MARPRNVMFYETTLPVTLSPQQYWLHDYHKNSKAVVDYLIDKRVGSSICRGTKSVLTCLRDYLLTEGKEYSPEEAKKWLAAHPKYTGVITLERLQDVYQYGKIQPEHDYPILYPYHKSLKEPWSNIVTTYTNQLIDISDRRRDSIRTQIERFFYAMQEQGIRNPNEITFDVLEKYISEDGHVSKEMKSGYTHAIGNVLTYMADQQLCKHGLGIYPYLHLHGWVIDMKKMNSEQIDRIHKAQAQNNEFPAEDLATIIPDFLNRMASHGYGKGTCACAKLFLQKISLFLEMNGLDYHPEIAKICMEYEQTVGQKKSWKAFRRTQNMLETYIQEGDIIPQIIYRETSLLCDQLPPWCRMEMDEYLKLRKREGLGESALQSIRASITRFCIFLTNHKVDSFSEITRELLRQFNLSDTHGSPESKNAYNVRIRKFLRHLERKEIIPYNMHHALLSSYAKRERLVITLNAEEKNKLMHNETKSPIDMRSHAIMLLGIQMGLRESDIVRIRLEDIDWERQTIRITQKKTSKEILQPMPVSVGNAIYKYIKEGRPNEKTTSGYLFIKHRAPYDALDRSVGYNSLHRMLPERKTKGSGFHVARKTFATDLLNHGNNRSHISDLLGHTDPHSLSTYLQYDEGRMKTCGISLEDAGLNMEEGKYGL